MFSRRWLVTTLLVIASMAVIIRMGIWQLDRFEASQAFDTHLIAMQKATLLVLDEAAISQDLTSMEYRQVKVSGTFDFEHQVALRNQYWGDPDGTAEYGFHLLTPLILETGQAVLVDRGWIPGAYDTPESWKQFDVSPGTDLIGIIRVPIQKGEMGGGVPNPAPVPGKPLALWNYLDLGRIQAQDPYQLLPVYIEQAPVDDLTFLPYRSLPALALNDVPHLGYAMLWLFFGCLLIFGYPVYLRRHIIS
jgi:cytochrome oxidase assembly protein ShyY1